MSQKLLLTLLLCFFKLNREEDAHLHNGRRPILLKENMRMQNESCGAVGIKPGNELVTQLAQKIIVAQLFLLFNTPLN